jgi:hypothetical protein
VLNRLSLQSYAYIFINVMKKKRETWPRPCNSSNIGFVFVVAGPDVGLINDKLS